LLSGERHVQWLAPTASTTDAGDVKRGLDGKMWVVRTVATVRDGFRKPKTRTLAKLNKREVQIKVPESSSKSKKVIRLQRRPPSRTETMVD
jgi:hypothetical protein